MTESDREYAPTPLCRRLHFAPRLLDPNLDPRRRSFITILQNVWVNGTRLRYHFLEKPPAERLEDQQAVIDAFQQWEDLGIGIKFEKVDDPREAEIRIAFRNDGSWSYVGRQALEIRDPGEPTMNFGWPLTTAHGRDTALHEIGHALGLEHEHQNHETGLVWDEQAVFAHFGGPPNSWTREQIQHNILDKVPMVGARGSTWDPDSIMQYSFRSGLILEPAHYRSNPLIPAGGLSEVDKREIRQLYPPMNSGESRPLDPFESEKIAIGPGQQLDFVIEPRFSRDYTIATFGTLDTVMVLFEMIDGVPRYVKGDDDSGLDRNARITQRLVKGREYRLRIRLYHASVQGEGAVMMW